MIYVVDLYNFASFCFFVEISLTESASHIAEI